MKKSYYFVIAIAIIALFVVGVSYNKNAATLNLQPGATYPPSPLCGCKVTSVSPTPPEEGYVDVGYPEFPGRQEYLLRNGKNVVITTVSGCDPVCGGGCWGSQLTFLVTGFEDEKVELQSSFEFSGTCVPPK